MGSELGKTRMADITNKGESFRKATASGKIRLKAETIRLIEEGKTAKGDPVSVAEVAAVMAAKNTPQIIPFCHPLMISNVETQASTGRDWVQVRVTVKSTGKTGVEMEAVTAVAAYLLTLWDMVKVHEKDEKGQYPDTAIEWIKVDQKEKTEKA